MQMQHYLQYQSNLVRGGREEGHTSRQNAVRSSLVGSMGLQVGGVCVVCLLGGRWKRCPKGR